MTAEQEAECKAEAEVLRTHPREEQKRVVATILKQAENSRLTAHERQEARQRGEALRRLLRLRS